MAESKLRREQRAEFDRYKDDVKREGKPFFPYAMWHDTMMSLVVVARDHRPRLRLVLHRRSTRTDGVGHPRPAVRGQGRPGYDELRAAARLVLLLPLLPPADLQVAGHRGPRHGRDPDDPADPADRCCRSTTGAGSAACRAGRSRSSPRCWSIISMATLTWKGATAKEALGLARTGALVPGWAEQQGFADNPDGGRGRQRCSPQAGCMNCHTYLGAGASNLGAPDLSATRAQGQGVDVLRRRTYAEPARSTAISVMPSFADLGAENLDQARRPSSTRPRAASSSRSLGRAPGHASSTLRAPGMRVFLGVTGASGAPYAARLLGALARAGCEVGLCASTAGIEVLATELYGDRDSRAATRCSTRFVGRRLERPGHRVRAATTRRRRTRAARPGSTPTSSARARCRRSARSRRGRCRT